MEHNILQRSVSVPWIQKAFVSSVTSLDMSKGNRLGRLCLYPRRLVAGLSIHQGHGLKAIKEVQTRRHCSMQQNAGDEDRTQVWHAKWGSIWHYQHSSVELFDSLLIPAKQKKEEAFTWSLPGLEITGTPFPFWAFCKNLKWNRRGQDLPS